MRALAALAIVVLAVSPAASAAAVDVDLSLPDAFRFDGVVLVTGAVRADGLRASEVRIVDATRLVLAPGVLHACPDRNGTSDRAPPVEAVDGVCRGGTSHADPRVAFGARTGLALEGTFAVTRAPAASLALFVADGGGAVWAASTSTDGVGLAADAAPVVFRSTGTAASVAVEDEDGTAYYNGTDWRFVYEGNPSFEVSGGGVVASVPTPLRLSATPAPPAAFREALDLRRLLDLQEAADGADAREPVRNVTAAFSGFTRVPALANGALLGRLNGTVAGLAHSPDAPSFVRFARLDVTLTPTSMRGEAEATYAASAAGFASAGDEPSRPPVVAGVLAWAVAALAVVALPAATARDTRSSRAAAAAGVVAAFVAWDVVVWSALGSSAGTLLAAGEPRGSVALLLAFEAFAFALAWLLLAWPARVALRRVLARVASRAAPYAGALASIALVVVLALAPFAFLALGHLVARL